MRKVLKAGKLCTINKHIYKVIKSKEYFSCQYCFFHHNKDDKGYQFCNKCLACCNPYSPFIIDYDCYLKLIK